MAASRKRSSKSKQTAKAAAKTAQGLGISPALAFILILLGAVFVYCIHLETGGEEIPDSAVSTFIDRDADLQIHFIDVGQGDCSLIMYKDSAMLIDCGEAEEAKTVISYIKKQGIEKLDYVVATHPHSDHMGAMSYIISEFEIGKVIAPRVKDELTPTSKVYKNFLQALKSKGLKLTAAKPKTSYSFKKSDEDDAPPQFEILAPLKDYDDLNNYSVVLRLTYGSTSYLFTGDAEKIAESDILDEGENVDSDVLKVGHHGSSTSTSEEFLEAVSPEKCVIQYGEGNSYGHPHAETIDAIENFGAEWYSTAQNGNIIIYSDGERIYVKTDR